MGESYDKTAAIVVLPAVGCGRLRDAGLRDWLARADLVDAGRPADWLRVILGELGKALPTAGLAALRFWGQTGDRPAAWMAAADPVYLEARLDHLCLFSPDEGEVASSELRLLIDHLQLTLGENSPYGFACIGGHGYLSADTLIATASCSPHAVDGMPPNDFLPGGDGAADYRRLLSEVEMALHDHPVNLERQAAGRRPVNSLWIWGGGSAPERVTEPLPPLFADDPLLRGYWDSKSAVAAAWPGGIAPCLEAAASGFVALAPAATSQTESLESWLGELKVALDTRRLGSLTLLFRDGLRARVVRSHGWRFWRRQNALLEEQPAA